GVLRVGRAGRGARWGAGFPPLGPGRRGDPLAVTAAGLLRCAFGSPFRPMALDPLWLSADVLLSARAIYQERAFDRLPALADLLEEEGATDAPLLAPLPRPAPPP